MDDAIIFGLGSFLAAVLLIAVPVSLYVYFTRDVRRRDKQMREEEHRALVDLLRAKAEQSRRRD